jgi:membrane associated rhomboid family serine protease
VIPLWDINATRRRPIVTYALFVTNLAVFAYMAMLPDAEAQHFVSRFAFVPAVLTDGELTVRRSDGGALGALVTPLTSMFLHGNGVHIAGNLLFLHVFGDNVEDVLGRPRFIAFYLGCGVVAAAAQMLVAPGSSTPMVGASGAISGVLAAYVVLFPGARVVTLMLFFLLEVPAIVFIVVWFALQVLSGLTSLGDVAAGGGGIAWFAHLGGFAAGIVSMKTWLARHRAPSVRTLRRRYQRPPWGAEP